MVKLSLLKFYELSVSGRGRKELVPNFELSLATIKTSIHKKLGVPTTNKAVLSSRALKHVYDRVLLDAKDSESFNLILKNLKRVLINPDCVYKNKQGKRGEFIFIKIVNGTTYLCSLETKNKKLYVVTAFLPKKDSYYKNLPVIWKF